MAIGKTFQETGEHYSIVFDSRTGVWRILDLWSPTLESKDYPDDIPDTDPAVTLLNQAAFEALMKEVKRLGIASKISGGEGSTGQLKAETPSKGSGKITVNTKGEERFRLVNTAMNNIIKLVGMGLVDSEVEEQ